MSSRVGSDGIVKSVAGTPVNNAKARDEGVLDRAKKISHGVVYASNLTAVDNSKVTFEANSESIICADNLSVTNSTVIASANNGMISSSDMQVGGGSKVIIACNPAGALKQEIADIVNGALEDF